MKNLINGFTVGIIMTLISLGIYFSDLPFFKFLELKAYDIKTRLRGVRPISNNIAIIAIDEKSLKEQGRWPWPRDLMSQLVNQLVKSEVAVLGFDIFFSEKQTSIPVRIVNNLFNNPSSPNDKASLNQEFNKISNLDGFLAEAILNSERSVLGYPVFVVPGKDAETIGKQSEEALGILSFSEYGQIPDDDNPIEFREIFGHILSLPELTNSANSLGFVSFVPQMDGIIRWIPGVMKFREGLYPPLAFKLLQQALAAPMTIDFAPSRVNGVRFGDHIVPTNEIGDYLVNYYGPGQTFKHFSATDILSGKIRASELEGKIILIGATALGIHDVHTTPFGPLYPGVEVHATVMENILNSDFLIKPDWLLLLDLAAIMISGLLFGALSLYFKAVGMVVLLFSGIVVYSFTDLYIFNKSGLVINTIFPIFTQMLVYTGITVYRFSFEEKAKRFIKGAFSQYLAPAVVERLTDNPDLLKLGGERKVLTAFFSDVAGFSTISEALSPEELVDLLNDYLTEMTDIILKYEGTVDKFEGDAIIAFFGAPLPFKDHAYRACMASIEMQKKLSEMREEWKKEGKHELFMRIGLNTGPMVVGNMGSKTRMDYTMMGDSVNLAARLEGVNKQYKTDIMISEFTKEEVGDVIETRELDLIRVVGKSEPVKIYEVFSPKGMLTNTLKGVVPIFDEGLNYYNERKWQDALDCFEKALDLDEKDGPSLTYFQRCIEYLEDPPPDDWDGIYVMKAK